MPPIQQHILYRLILARTLFKRAIESFATNTDVYSVSHGLISLHDALDNFTGAVASHITISLKKNNMLLDAMKDIEDHERKTDPSYSLSSHNEIAQLNTIRNSIKHNGVMPNIAQAKSLIAPITTFFQDSTKKYFGLEWDFIGLSDLVKDSAVKQSIKAIESLIEQGNYKEALDSMAITRFQVFDESHLKMRLNPSYDVFSPPSAQLIKLRTSNNIFPDQADNRGLLFSDINDRADYLEKGIDRKDLDQFKDLTAKVGFKSSTDFHYVLDHGYSWGEANWTKEICLFCHDFLIEIILKNQGKNSVIDVKRPGEIHLIKTENDLQLFDKDNNPKAVFPADQEREAFLIGFRAGNWEIFNENDRVVQLMADDQLEEIFGFFAEGDEAKIKIIKTRHYSQDENGNPILIKEETF